MIDFSDYVDTELVSLCATTFTDFIIGLMQPEVNMYCIVYHLPSWISYDNFD